MFIGKKILLRSLNQLMGTIIRRLRIPTPLLHVGPDCSLNLCDDIVRFGATRVLIVTDKILLDLGVLDKMQERLTHLGASVTIYSGIQPDPTFAHVREGIALVRQHQCDAVLAVGGGSAIDAAKGISAGAVINEDVMTLAGFMKIKTPGLPFYVVPTTAGTGAEVSLAAVISDPDTHKKSGLVSPLLIPRVAALDPVVMQGMPPFVTATTGIDALTHAIESYISRNARAESERFALSAIQLIFANLEVAYKQGDDLQARQSMAVASTYAGLAFSKTFVGYVHAISHALGGTYGIPHGLANGIVLPHVLRFSVEEVPERFAAMAIAAGLGNQGDDEHTLAMRFVNEVQALIDRLGIPRTVEKLQTQDMETLAAAALKEAHVTYAVPRFMSKQDCLDMLAAMKPA